MMNDDMISRQNVLRCLTDISYNHCKTQGEADVIDTAKTMVAVMPSAQPDLCDGCDRYGASCVGEGCGKLEMPEVAKDTNVPINDCISRRAAIEVILADKIDNKSLEVMDALGSGNEAKTLNMTCDRHAELLKSLPSAQPEPIKITIDHVPTKDESERLKQAMRNTPVMLLPYTQPEIIRCNDCKHRRSSLYCEAWNNSPGFPCIGDEMFCSMAERRNDGQTD